MNSVSDGVPSFQSDDCESKNWQFAGKNCKKTSYLASRTCGERMKKLNTLKHHRRKLSKNYQCLIQLKTNRNKITYVMNFCLLLKNYSREKNIHFITTSVSLKVMSIIAEKPQQIHGIAIHHCIKHDFSCKRIFFSIHSWLFFLYFSRGWTRVCIPCL